MSMRCSGWYTSSTGKFLHSKKYRGALSGGRITDFTMWYGRGREILSSLS